MPVKPFLTIPQLAPPAEAKCRGRGGTPGVPITPAPLPASCPPADWRTRIDVRRVRTRPPLFIRRELGNTSLSSFANCTSLELGSLAVVISTCSRGARGQPHLCRAQRLAAGKRCITGTLRRL